MRHITLPTSVFHGLVKFRETEEWSSDNGALTRMRESLSIELYAGLTRLGRFE